MSFLHSGLGIVRRPSKQGLSAVTIEIVSQSSQIPLRLPNSILLAALRIGEELAICELTVSISCAG
jgi:hypothetical protein